MSLRWFALGLAVTLGCTSYQTLTLPRTIPAGEWRFAVAPTMTSGFPVSPSSAFAPVLPTLSVMIRRGLSERLEVGVELEPLARAELDLKVQLLQARTDYEGFDLAVAPSAGYGLDFLDGGDFAPNIETFTAQLPLLVGVNVGDRHQIVLAPRCAYELWFGRSSFVHGGGSFGIAFRFDDFSLMPQVTYLHTWSGQNIALPGPNRVQLGVVLFVGSR
ncbi:MAG: hypothetical protein ACOZIN_20535 [Myxococcota bacterium]